MKNNISKLEIDEAGNRYWWLNGKWHRVDGPAVEYINGNKEWYLNGIRHRIDGPAVEFTDGSKEWYINGVKYKGVNIE